MMQIGRKSISYLKSFLVPQRFVSLGDRQPAQLRFRANPEESNQQRVLDRQKSGNQCDLYIQSLHWTTASKHLRNYLQQFGPVRECRVMHSENGISRGIGFATMRDKKDVREIMAEIEHVVDGKTIMISERQKGPLWPKRFLNQGKRNQNSIRSS